MVKGKLTVHTEVLDIHIFHHMNAPPFLPLLIERILDFSLHLEVRAALRLGLGGAGGRHLLHLAGQGWRADWSQNILR